MAGATFSGPFFDANAGERLARMATDVETDIAKAAEDTWQAYMDASFRHNGGRYQSFVNIADRDDAHVVNDGWPDSDLKYGPWLEGVGSRNSPVTRFPGYFALRRAAETTRQNVQALAEPVVTKAVEDLNA